MAVAESEDVDELIDPVHPLVPDDLVHEDVVCRPVELVVQVKLWPWECYQAVVTAKYSTGWTKKNVRLLQ